jgi:hypothetical protein
LDVRHKRIVAFVGPGFNDSDGDAGVCGQSVCQDEACRPGADDDIVEGLFGRGRCLSRNNGAKGNGDEGMHSGAQCKSAQLKEGWSYLSMAEADVHQVTMGVVFPIAYTRLVLEGICGS